MARVYGYLRDPLTRPGPGGSETDLLASDRKIKDLLPLLASSPGDVDLSKYCIAMDQYDLSSCVGNGTAESLEMLENIAHEGIPGYQPTPLSRLFIYALARIEDGDHDAHGDPTRDAGTHIRSAFDVIGRFGVCTEALWPYQDALVLKSPSFLAQRQALGHKIHAAYRVDSTGDQRVNDIVAALQAKHPVVFGTNVTPAFEALKDGTPIGQPGSNDQILGGHCMVIVGYLNGNFLIKNSWGTEWAMNGLCFMRPDYITWDQTTDLWVPTIGTDFKRAA